MKHVFRIKGMMCNHCKAHVESALMHVAGVTAVEVDLAAGTARVEGTFDPERIIATIRELGYEYVA